MKTATTIKERPILFSGPMVNAILAGRKTQTRRNAKPQPHEDWRPDHYGEIHKMIDGDFPLRNGLPITIGWGALNDEGDWGIVCPYGKPGDRLWVREAWSPDHRDFYPNFPIVYRASFGPEYERNERGEVYSSEQKAWYPFRWRPSIHMPRTASRISLEIKSVRVERLQEISEQDAKAEGVESGVQWKDGFCESYVMQYERLWKEINGPESWDANPWVWVVEFSKI